MLKDPPRSPTLDFLIGIVGLWLAAGFLWDSWAHLHVGIETFFTPYHDVFYCAMLAGSTIMGIAARRNYALRYRGRHVLSLPYQRALLGIPIFFLGGIGDFFWHAFVGVENRIEAVTSPTHLIIGFGVVTVLSGPIRSALAAPARLRSLRDQLPLIFALAACSEFVHLGMSYAFDPSAARAYAPPNGFIYSADYFTATAIVLYKTGTGVMIVILESIALMGFAVWMASRFALAPGAMTLFILLADGMIATALGIGTPLLAIHLAMALVAGIVADVLIGRTRPAQSMNALRTFGMVVPVAYFGTYFALTIALQGTWWNWNLVLGTLVWSALAGGALTFLVGERPSPSLRSVSLADCEALPE